MIKVILTIGDTNDGSTGLKHKVEFGDVVHSQEIAYLVRMSKEDILSYVLNEMANQGINLELSSRPQPGDHPLASLIGMFSGPMDMDEPPHTDFGHVEG